MEYNFRDIEKKWQSKWIVDEAYKVSNNSDKPKYYVLDMFPYPSGAGLHVGHPLGYIASDIVARYKRLKGFNVLHPMGYDAFGLPAEQYALEHGVHPAESTEKNISTFRRQLDNIGFSFDWSREIRTSTPAYYKWTQWIFLQLFNSWYNRQTDRTEGIELLEQIFERDGNAAHPVPRANFQVPGGNTNTFTASEWRQFSETTRATILMEYRVAYCGYGEVNWCEALGTVLANDEVVNGVSERGGFPVEKKRLRQWYLRITEYADRLLNGLQTVDFSEAMKEMQSNWIGKSTGAEIWFTIGTEQTGKADKARIACYTTRPDTIFGVDFLVLAPEHDLVEKVTTAMQKEAVDEYIVYVKSRSERERMAEKKITGVFTGAFAEHPFSGKPIPVWISEYVLAGYGTGAIMAVPSGDERDHKFALHFNLPVTNIVGAAYTGEGAYISKDLVLENSDFLTGMNYDGATTVVLQKLEERGVGKRKVNYKMRDAAFSRQRYWGEPFPILWQNGVASSIGEDELPLELPHVEAYKPGPEGEGPLANIEEWANIVEDNGSRFRRETNTMPGYAGSSWYFLRYMDPHNDATFCDKSISTYWNQVDLYVGGTEHAVGHLLYSRMWTKCLYDLGHITFEEPFKRLLNQGMIQGSSRFVYRLSNESLSDISNKDLVNAPAQLFVSKGIFETLQGSVQLEDQVAYLQQYLPDHTLLESFSGFGITYSSFRVDVNIVDGVELDKTAFRSSKPEFSTALLLLEDGSLDTPEAFSASPYICGSEVEKMSKSKYNTVNPDVLVERYGADTFRMYEMFLGPVEMSKPWDTKGIEGVHRFLKKLWRLFYLEDQFVVNSELPTPAELKALHKTIKKIEEDTERFSFNTCISAFMVCVNELTDLGCHKRHILSHLVVLLAPYAPHIASELWEKLLHAFPGTFGTGLLLDAPFPQWEEQYLVESVKEYPVSINGKLRTTIPLELSMGKDEVETVVLQNAVVLKWLEGQPPKKIIFVQGKMINVVV